MRHRALWPLILGCVLIAATPLTTAAPAQAAGIGSMAGTVTDHTGAPLAGAEVSVSTDGMTWRQSTSNATGQFTIALTVGDYKVRVRAPGGLVQYAPGQAAFADAGVYPVTAGQRTQLTEQLMPSGNVRISLYDGTSSAPLTRGCVTISTSTSRLCDRADGLYSFVGVPLGDVKVSVDGTKTSWPTTRSITVSAGVDDHAVHLDTAAAIQTTFVAADDASAHPAFCAFAVYRGASSTVHCADADGTLLIGPLPSAAVQLFAVSPDAFNGLPFHPVYGAQWVGSTGGTGDQRLAKKITTTVGTVTTIPPIRLDHAGSIAGTVDDPYYGESGTRAYVRPFGLQDGLRGIGATIDSPGLQQWAYIGGTYELAGLGPYAWPVEFMGDRGVYADQWSGNAPNRYLATPVQVRAGSVSTLNATLVFAPASVSGEIRLTTGTATGGYRVSAENAFTGDITGLSQVNGDTFSIQGLAGDSIHIRYGMIGGPTVRCLITIPARGRYVTGVVLTLPNASSCAREPVVRRTTAPSTVTLPGVLRRVPSLAAIAARRGD